MYETITPDTWSGRTDTPVHETNKRWHQIIQYADLSGDLPVCGPDQSCISFLGFCSDEGVRRNQGRPGAFQGPRSLRKACANLAVHFDTPVRLVDAGDVVCRDRDLEQAQRILGDHVRTLLDAGFFTILMGGGHEIAYGHYLGIAAHCRNRAENGKIGIISFDAHFDLRPSGKGASSGTPFYQIAEWCRARQRDFSCLCIGVQEEANTISLYETADRLGVFHISTRDMENPASVVRRINHYIKDKTRLYLTVCLDVFAAPFAPGVSAISGGGLLPGAVFPLIDRIMASGKVISCDVAELNPEYDTDNRTAKLAAAVIYRMAMGKIRSRRKQPEFGKNRRRRL